MPRGVLKANLPSKLCQTCGLPFTWRKKVCSYAAHPRTHTKHPHPRTHTPPLAQWEKCWDEVTTCSKRCNTARRRAAKRAGKAATANQSKPARVKACEVCETPAEVLFRCRWTQQHQSARSWHFVCRPCWPSVAGRLSTRESLPGAGAGGAPQPENPLYQYGGTWKSTIGHLTAK